MCVHPYGMMMHARNMTALSLMLLLFFTPFSQLNLNGVEDDSKELIIMDRRIFFDDRRIEDDDINYGQVLLTK